MNKTIWHWNGHDLVLIPVRDIPPIKFSNAFMTRHYDELARLAREAAEHEQDRV